MLRKCLLLLFLLQTLPAVAQPGFPHQGPPPPPPGLSGPPVPPGQKPVAPMGVKNPGVKPRHGAIVRMIPGSAEKIARDLYRHNQIYYKKIGTNKYKVVPAP